MITPRIRPVEIGECEACGKTGIEVYKTMHGNMLLCKEHYDAEQSAYAKEAKAKTLIQQFRDSDASISTRGDIHLVKNVPMVELQAAIANDASIPADKKDEVYADECLKHRDRIDEILFSKRQEMQELELERRLWIVNGQNAVSRIRADVRAKNPRYAELNTNYTAGTPSKKQKTAKEKTVKTPTVSGFNKKEFYAALNDYDVTAYSVEVRMTMQSRNLSAVDAARAVADTHFAGLDEACKQYNMTPQQVKMARQRMSTKNESAEDAARFVANIFGLLD